MDTPLQVLLRTFFGQRCWQPGDVYHRDQFLKPQGAQDVILFIFDLYGVILF